MKNFKKLLLCLALAATAAPVMPFEKVKAYLTGRNLTITAGIIGIGIAAYVWFTKKPQAPQNPRDTRAQSAENRTPLLAIPVDLNGTGAIVVPLYYADQTLQLEDLELNAKINKLLALKLSALANNAFAESLLNNNPTAITSARNVAEQARDIVQKTTATAEALRIRLS